MNKHIHMATEIVHAKVLAWGGSVGIRISKAEAERHGLRPGQEVDIQLLRPSQGFDISAFHFFHDRGDVSIDHDRYLGEARSHDVDR